MSDVTIRTTEDVSIRAIAEDGEGMTSPVDLRDLAKKRGIDRTFALRELITSQAFSNSEIDGLRASDESEWQNWLDDYDTTAATIRLDDSNRLLLADSNGTPAVRFEESVPTGERLAGRSVVLTDEDGNAALRVEPDGTVLVNGSEVATR